MKNYLAIFLLFFPVLGEASAAQSESIAKNFALEKRLFPGAPQISAQYQSSIFKKSDIVLVKNAGAANALAVKILVRSGANSLVLANNFRGNIGAFNMALSFEGMQIGNASAASNLVGGLLNIAEPGARLLKCEPISQEYRCFYNSPYGASYTVFVQKNALLRAGN